jgi:bifunctional ADP-heptose synthase (sugar kinase/adenylyltransferase)
LVVGDFMTDRYLMASIRGRSPEQADCDVWTINETIEMPGGAGNVVTNLYALGQSVISVGSPMPYPIKNRIIIEGKQVARFDENDRCKPIDLEWLIKCLNLDVDGVIVSDYSKGSINSYVRKALIDSGLPLFVDSKGDPADWFEGGDVWFFPNSGEFAAHEANFRKASQVIYKQGSDGIARLHKGTEIEGYQAFTKPHQLLDVTGAGDTVIAAFATQLLAKPTVFSPLLFANLAAALAVQKPLTSTVTLDEILALIEAQ